MGIKFDYVIRILNSPIMDSLLLCQRCKETKGKWIVPNTFSWDWDFNEDRFKILDVLTGKITLCCTCQREYCVADTQITIATYTRQSKLITCNCDPLGVAIYSNNHQCKDIERRAILPQEDDRGHAIDTCCEMYITYWTRYRTVHPYRRTYKNEELQILHNIHPLLCMYNICYATHAHVLCDKCSTHIHYCTLGRPSLLRTEISNELPNICKCGNTGKFIADNNQLYCKTCFPRDMNVYKLQHGLNKLLW